jgi:hypothetical protein
MGNFEVCPNELLYSVLSLLDVSSLGRLAQVNSTFKLIAEGTPASYRPYTFRVLLHTHTTLCLLLCHFLCCGRR